MKWEHRTIRYNKKISFWDPRIDYAGFDKKTNVLGAQGWQLVSSYALHRWGSITEVVATFKREIRTMSQE